jgi:SAM-dependent methyltransferase
MAYDETLAGQIRDSLAHEPGMLEKELFGGVGFMLDGNAAVGVVGNDMIVRVGPSVYEEALTRRFALPFESSGRLVKDWVIVERAGLCDNAVFASWLHEGVSYARSLPACPRYAAFPDMRERVGDLLKPGMRVLDVGAGATPTVASSARPPGTHYVGLDISREELLRAQPGSYDEIRVCSILDPAPDLVGEFDLIVTLQTLEHVKPLETAILNLRSYLRPGGEFVGQMTGTFTYFSLLNRVMPTKLKNTALSRFHWRQKEDVFPAYYDRCWHGALNRIFGSWREVEIEPFYAGGGYLTFSERLFKIYLRYEDWVERNNHRNLASHYIVRAVN